jgi:CRP-like cAMP-binding protein
LLPRRRFGDNATRDGGIDGVSAVAKKSKSKFDPEAFLAKVDGGVAISKYRKGQVVFTQGEPADSVFYIREGRVKVFAEFSELRCLLKSSQYRTKQGDVT